MVVYIDAEFSAHPDGKGHSGFVLMWGNVPLLVLSKKQRLATKDSIESELVALSDFVAKVDYTQGYVLTRGYNLEEPIVFNDNTSTITII